MLSWRRTDSRGVFKPPRFLPTCVNKCAEWRKRQIGWLRQAAELNLFQKTTPLNKSRHKYFNGNASFNWMSVAFYGAAAGSFKLLELADAHRRR